MRSLLPLLFQSYNIYRFISSSAQNMEFKMINQSLYGSTKENQPHLEFQDKSLLYKLKRSYEKIEQLKDQASKLRRDNELKLKIIASLQDKQKQSLKVISVQHISIQKLQEQLSVYLRRFKENKIIQRQSEIDMIQFDKLKIKYENCQEENIFLRDQIDQKVKEIQVIKEAFLQQRTWADKKQNEIDMIHKQLECERHQRLMIEARNKELQSEKGKLLEKLMKNENVLNEYGEMIGRLNVNLMQTSKLQQTWQSKYHDISDTVDHIQNLRETFRIRRILNP